MIRNTFIKWLYNLYLYHIRHTSKLIPLVYSIFPTYRCNFRCAYCDNGTEAKYPELIAAERDTDAFKRIIEMIRRESNLIAFGGGEPLMRTDLEELIAYARKIGFKRIMMNTNSLGILKRPSIIQHLDDIMISLDSMDREYLDRLYGVRNGTAERIIENLKTLAEMQREHSFRLIINSVIMPENILSLYDVMAFCIELGITFSPAPLLVGPYPDNSLVGNEEYMHLIDSIIDIKRRGMPVLETFIYLSSIREFSPFTCLPTVYMRISPAGELLFPCMILSRMKVDVLAHNRLIDAVRHASTAINLNTLHCDNRCHVNCYLEASTSVAHPGAVFSEAAQLVRLRLKEIGSRKNRGHLIDVLEKHRKNAVKMRKSNEKELAISGKHTHTLRPN